jgi:hypothetical protein
VGQTTPESQAAPIIKRSNRICVKLPITDDHRMTVGMMDQTGHRAWVAMFGKFWK